MNKLLVLKESEDNWNEKYAANRFYYPAQVTELGKE